MYLLDTKITKIAVLINIMQSVHLRAWRGLWKLYYFLLLNILLLLLSGFNVSNAQRKLLLWFKVELFLLLARCERVMPWSDNKYVSWNSDVFYSLFCHDLKLLGSRYYRISQYKIILRYFKLEIFPPSCWCCTDGTSCTSTSSGTENSGSCRPQQQMIGCTLVLLVAQLASFPLW